VVRAGLEAIVRESPDLQVVGALGTLTGLDREIEALRPDVILVATGIGREGDLRLSVSPDVPAIVLLTEDPDGTGGVEALRTGGRAVLPRDAQPQQIIAAVQAAAAGLAVLHVQSAAPLLQHLTGFSRAEEDVPVETLTPREVEVLGMLAEGQGNKQIARKLGISEHTVKFHVGSIMAKLHASSRTEAVTVGIRHGLVLL
jgi:DNA-binding NarL/FixJ family response regulator